MPPKVNKKTQVLAEQIVSGTRLSSKRFSESDLSDAATAAHAALGVYPTLGGRSDADAMSVLQSSVRWISGACADIALASRRSTV
jgi:hypothetical protein